LKYRRLGRTNIEVFPVAFGGIPIQRIDEESAIKVIRRAIELGINLIDTARAYTDSEVKIGKAIKGINKKVYLASKSQSRTKDGVIKDIEISLKNLGVDQIDIYQLHGINDLDTFKSVFSEDGAYWGLVEAKDKGLIRHIAASSHSIDVLEKLIETNRFDVIQLCYNIVETEVEEKIFPLALEKDIGIIAMKPIGGGVIPNPSLSLKYVLQKEFVVPDPGIETIEELEENIKVALNMESLTEDEMREIARIKKEMGKEFCRRCNYCQPCPQDIPIWVILHAESAAKRLPSQTLKTGWFYDAYQKAKSCIKCRVCVTRCPYNLPIPELIERNIEYAKRVLGE